MAELAAPLRGAWLANPDARAAPSRCAAARAAPRSRRHQPARLRCRPRSGIARLAGEAGRDRPFDGRADRAAAVRARPGPRRRAAHTRGAFERNRDPAVEPRRLRPHPDEMGLVAQAAPRDPRRGAVAHLQHHRSRRGQRTTCRLRARFGPRPVRDGAALARRQKGDDDRSPLRHRAAAVRCCREGPTDAAGRRAPRRALLRTCFRLRRISGPGPLGARPAGLGAGRRRCRRPGWTARRSEAWRSSTSRN